MYNFLYKSTTIENIHKAQLYHGKGSVIKEILDLTKTFLGRLNKIGMFKGLKTEKYGDLCSQKKDSCGKIKKAIMR